MTDEIEMPCECNRCGGVWDLTSTYPDPRDRSAVVCPPCRNDILRESDTDDGI
jgi:hypothetical protein